MEVIKTELSILVPKELSINLDFWYQIRDNISSGYLYIPYSFTYYLGKKYGYPMEIIDSQEIREWILFLSIKLFENQSIMNKYRNISPPKDIYVDLKDYKDEVVNSRLLLANSTPVAEFVD